jgi:hypothetical protein
MSAGGKKLGDKLANASGDELAAEQICLFCSIRHP